MEFGIGNAECGKVEKIGEKQWKAELGMRKEEVKTKKLKAEGGKGRA